ncbi:MAG: hypothetical protein AAF668_08645 [Pseudomonadota bacterium]
MDFFAFLADGHFLAAMPLDVLASGDVGLSTSRSSLFPLNTEVSVLAASAAVPIAIFLYGGLIRSRSALVGGALVALIGYWVAMAAGAVPPLASGSMIIFKGCVGAALLLFAGMSLQPARANTGVALVLAGSAVLVLGASLLNSIFAGLTAGFVDGALVVSVAGVLGLAGFGLLKGDAGSAFFAPGIVAGVLGLMFASTGGAMGAAAALFAIGGVAIASFGATAGEFLERPQLGGVFRERGVSKENVTPTFQGKTSRVSNGSSRYDLARLLDEKPADTGPTEEDSSADGPALPASSEGSSESAALESYDSQLAQALDYVGVAVWDWTPKLSKKTASFATVLSLKDVAIEAPSDFVGLFDQETQATMQTSVLGTDGTDGSFDMVCRLKNDKPVRVRGARAATPDGKLERLVVFVERADSKDLPKGTAAQETDSADENTQPETQGAQEADEPTPETPVEGEKIDLKDNGPRSSNSKKDKKERAKFTGFSPNSKKSSSKKKLRGIFSPARDDARGQVSRVNFVKRGSDKSADEGQSDLLAAAAVSLSSAASAKSRSIDGKAAALSRAGSNPGKAAHDDQAGDVPASDSDQGTVDSEETRDLGGVSKSDQAGQPIARSAFVDRLRTRRAALSARTETKSESVANSSSSRPKAGDAADKKVVSLKRGGEKTASLTGAKSEPALRDFPDTDEAPKPSTILTRRSSSYRSFV